VSTRGDFEPLIDEATFYRAQAVLDRRVVVAELTLAKIDHHADAVDELDVEGILASVHQGTDETVRSRSRMFSKGNLEPSVGLEATTC
jgi:hypothetical protein